MGHTKYLDMFFLSLVDYIGRAIVVTQESLLPTFVFQKQQSSMKLAMCTFYGKLPRYPSYFLTVLALHDSVRPHVFQVLAKIS